MTFLNLFRARLKTVAIFQPSCHVCGRPSAVIRMVTNESGTRVVYRGICGGSGPSGTPATSAQLNAIALAFVPPYEQARIKDAGFYDDAGFCGQCGRFYCAAHWNISTTGGGTCPGGHFKSLDQHWSPE